MRTIGDHRRRPAHVQNVPQLQPRVLLETVPARALARPPAGVRGPPGGRAVPVGGGRGES